MPDSDDDQEIYDNEQEQDDSSVNPDFIDEPDIEIEDAADPDEEGYEEGGYETLDFYENLVEYMPADERDELAAKYLDLYDRDKTAREKRDKQYEEGIRRTGVSNDAPGGADFMGASKVVHPGLAEACIDFCARTIKELCPPVGPVKIKIDGKLTKAKLDKAERKRRHMNWQMTNQIREYRNVLEQVLTQLPLGGSQFIKFYPDFIRKRPACEMVRIDNLFLPYSATDFYATPRLEHRQFLTQYEFDRRCSSGFYMDPGDLVSSSEPDMSRVQMQMDKIEGKETTGMNEDGDREVVEFYIQETLSIDDKADKDLVTAPYIITLDYASSQVISIYRNWEENDKTQESLVWIVKFGFLPWDGPLEIGLTHAIGTMSGAATGALRGLLDSAHMQNVPTAVMLKGNAISGQSKRVGPTQITEIQARAGVDDISKIFMHLPYNPPSQVLFQLLGFLDQKMSSVVRTALDQTAEDNQNMPVGTKLANIEQGLVVYSSIHQRLHSAQARCLEVIHRLNRMYMDDDLEYDEELGFAVRADYEGEIDVQPVSDPTIFSETQRMGQLQAVVQLAQLNPNFYDWRAIHKWALAIMRIPNAEELMPDVNKPKDQNPATENIMMAMGQAAIALPDQDHLAHLQILLDFMKSPMFGANPIIGPKYLPLATQHGIQHALFLYGDVMKQYIEKAMGAPITDVQDEDPVVAKKFQQALAHASPMVLADVEKLLAGGMPILQAAFKQVQATQPPPPTDPSTVMMAAEKNRAAEAQADNQLDQQKLSEQTAADAREAELKEVQVEAEVQNNKADNITALEIAGMRAESGHGVGGLKDGTSLGR